MRRSRSTSAWEYRRVPLGERLGSIRPRASYIRSVCGCICGSSAATEIMNTPRRRSTAIRVRLVTTSRRAIACLAARARVGRAASSEQLRARVAVEHLGHLLDDALLVGAE